ncbi:MAG: type II toxin-antitoxin system VapC family toxin [Nitrospirae bacterium]|jgi:PIN domain nuclease of toxin-antitoxin system|nr:type II toxin-antitoxin system VapC family toxin [Nitrospirota bacterium]MDA8059818.1 type II toxin-antitoxin system VapC family toxin [Nitrospiraceae bacterium]
MKTICDTHVLLFWAHEPDRLTTAARQILENHSGDGSLACADITWWEIALLEERGRIRLPPDVTPQYYMQELIKALRLDVLPITPDIAALSVSEPFRHKDPADRLIAATAIIHRAPLITADEQLRSLPRLKTIW